MAKQNNKEKRIGKVILMLDDLVGEGRYGSVFKGKYEAGKEVAVKRVVKNKTKVDLKLIEKIGLHTNIVFFYGTEGNDPEYM